MRRLPPLNSIRVFEAAARLGSFTKAAEELCVTPSAVSHQLKSLEEFFGQELFKRENRSTSLTAAGELYLSSVQVSLDELELATRKMFASPSANLVNVSVPPVFLTRWLVPRIAQFQEKHPEIELRLKSAVEYIDFDNSDTDVAVYYGNGSWRGVEAKLLKNIHLTPVMSPSLLPKDGSAFKPENIFDHTLIQLTGRQQEWIRILQRLGLSIAGAKKSISFSSTSVAVSAATEGIGVALADSSLLQREIKAGLLVAPFDVVLDLNSAFYLVYKQDSRLTPAMNTFKDWILSEMQAME